MALINLSGSVGATGIPILGRISIVNLDAPYTLSAAEYTNRYINVTGTLTSQRDIIAPLTTGVEYAIRNSTTDGYSIRIIGPTGSGVLVSPGSIINVICDGDNFITSGAPVITDFTGYGIIQDGVVEVEQYLTSVRFKALYNTIPTLAQLTDDDTTPLKDVSATPDIFSSDGYFQKLAFGEEVNFTLTIDTYYTSTFKVVWGQRNYFGIGAAGGNSEAFIKTLGSIVNNSVETIFTVNAGASDKIYFAYRTAYGTPTILVNGFEGGFTLVSTTIPVANPYGFIENYTLYESDNLNLGITSIEAY